MCFLYVTKTLIIIGTGGIKADGGWGCEEEAESHQCWKIYHLWSFILENPRTHMADSIYLYLYKGTVNARIKH